LLSAFVFNPRVPEGKHDDDDDDDDDEDQAPSQNFFQWGRALRVVVVPPVLDITLIVPQQAMLVFIRKTYGVST